ncbi:putative E3 ubiquitin-protein ligase TRIML1 [Sminthopsis crassicaudata]|uniref:putative E3 ubiquitin-protein ligase TRIML1 n=1 Tax=Sminthopsis crassicaudata TaxID=9301 RepID=UPI003D69911E
MSLNYLPDWVTESAQSVFSRALRESLKPKPTQSAEESLLREAALLLSRNLQTQCTTDKMSQNHLLHKDVSLSTCDQQGEQVIFFCEEDQRPLFDSCFSGPELKDHQVLPLETAADKSKNKLLQIWRIIQKKKEKCQTALDTLRRREAQFIERSSTLKVAAVCEYGKLQQFLMEEKSIYEKSFVEASTSNLLKLAEHEMKVLPEIQKLKQMMLQVEQNLDMLPLEMIQAAPDTLKKKEELLQRPEFPFLPWPICSITGMREFLMSFHRDITLDPESAHPHLILSEDLKRVHYGSTRQDLPDNTERFHPAFGVLGTQKFISGTHYWEVEVEDKTGWALGVCNDSGGRFSWEDVLAITAFTSGNGFFLYTSEKTIQLSQPLHKVGIFLDCERTFGAPCQRYPSLEYNLE